MIAAARAQLTLSCALASIADSCVAGQRVLELGCGTGAVGCAAAVLGAGSVTLTDLPVLLPLVRQNIEVRSAGAEFV